MAESHGSHQPTTDRLVGRAKQAVGSLLGRHDLRDQGRMQRSRADAVEQAEQGLDRAEQAAVEQRRRAEARADALQRRAEVERAVADAEQTD